MGREEPVWRTNKGIPVRNLWLLMLYASELRYQDPGPIGSEKSPEELPDLVAELLCHAVERRLRQNLSLGYVSEQAVRSRVRGQVDMLKSERRGLFRQGRVACRYQELTMNTPRNRYVRGALAHLAGLAANYSLRQRCRMLAARLEQAGVIGHPPGRSLISQERYGRHDQHDRPMVTAALLAFELKIPTEEGNQAFLVQASHEEQWLRRLFEKAVAGFYEVVIGREQGWQVHPGRKRDWPVEAPTNGFLNILPGMETDIELEHRPTGRRIVVDTKFAPILTKNAQEQERLKSAYLYQMYAYLRTQEDPAEDATLSSEGLLLHPSIGECVDEEATIQGHRFRVATVDLAAGTEEVRRQLLERIGARPPHGFEPNCASRQ